MAFWSRCTCKQAGSARQGRGAHGSRSRSARRRGHKIPGAPPCTGGAPRSVRAQGITGPATHGPTQGAHRRAGTQSLTHARRRPHPLQFPHRSRSGGNDQAVFRGGTQRRARRVRHGGNTAAALDLLPENRVATRSVGPPGSGDSPLTPRGHQDGRAEDRAAFGSDHGDRAQPAEDATFAVDLPFPEGPAGTARGHRARLGAYPRGRARP